MLGGGGRGGHGGRGGRGGRGGEGGRRGGRFYGRGDLRLVLLSLIAEKPRHGYDLIRAIAESTGGVYRPSPGVVYPTLTLLEDLGHVRTSLGEDHGACTRSLRRGVPSSRRIASRSRACSRGSPGGFPAEVETQVREVRAAMEQLKQALRATLSAGPVDATRLARIVTTIEQAARDVAGSEAR